MSQAPAITSAGMWTAALVAAAAFFPAAALLGLWIRPPLQPQLSRRLLVVGTLFFAILFTWAFWSFWDRCYAYALPSAMKALAPLLGGSLGALGWVFWRFARRTGRWAVPVFLALGALESVPGHLNAIHRFHLLERCPLLQGVSPPAALVFGLFEFGLYWCAVLALSRMSRPGR